MDHGPLDRRRLISQLGGRRHGHVAGFDRLDHLRLGVPPDLPRRSQTEVRNVQQFCGFRLAYLRRILGRLQIRALALPHGGESLRDHRPLALAQVAAVQVQGHHEAQGVVALVETRRAGDDQRLADPVAVAAVQNAPLIEPNRLPHPMGRDIRRQGLEVLVGQRREQVRQGMGLERLVVRDPSP